MKGISITPYTSENPAPSIVIEPSKGWLNLNLSAVWQYRELLYFLVWRDIKVRYKQTALGVTWIVLQPVVSVLVFNVLFGMLLKVPTGDIPYPLFALSGLLPWQYFASSLTRSTNSLIDNSNLITKVYFPRLTIPIAGVLSGLVDFGISFVLLALLMAFYHTPLTPAVLFLPVLLLLAVATALGVGLWLSALNVRYRDVKQLIPFFVQIWMYLTPVVYSVKIIPERFQWVLGLNPMTGVVEGFRWALFGSELSGVQTPGLIFWISVLLCGVVFLGGLIFFRKSESSFSDII